MSAGRVGGASPHEEPESAPATPRHSTVRRTTLARSGTSPAPVEHGNNGRVSSQSSAPSLEVPSPDGGKTGGEPSNLNALNSFGFLATHMPGDLAGADGDDGESATGTGDAVGSAGGSGQEETDETENQSQASGLVRTRMAGAERVGPLITKADQPTESANDGYIPGSDGRSVFVPARAGMPFRQAGSDAWTAWADVHRRNIVGTQGVAALAQAFEQIGQSRAFAVGETLTRKGIAISFGEPSDFTGVRASAIAYFDFSKRTKPPGPPKTEPTIKFNPQFVNERPEVLAAALVHEGTHFRQFLDGTLLNPTRSNVDIECDAWWNEAAFWDEMRGKVWPIDTALERESEFAYRTALQGEARLRELLTALER